MPSWRHGARGGRRRLGERRERDPRAGRPQVLAALRRHRAPRAVERADHARRRCDAGGARAAQRLRRAQRRLRRRAEVPAGLDDRVPARPRRARDVARHAARDGRAAGSTTRSAAASPATRSTRPGRCPTSRRCSTTTRCWPAPTCTAGRSRARSGCARCAARRSTGRCARCAARRAASAAALDADSEGVEGKFYVWTPERAARGARASAGRAGDRLLRRHRAGNFERGSTSSRRAGPSRQRLAEIRRRLSARARARVRPGLDDKRLTAWNALMISALAEAGAVLERARLPRRRASACATFVLERAARRATAACCAPGRTAGPHRRLPRGPRVPARGADHPVRGDLRPALVSRGGARSPTR